MMKERLLWDRFLYRIRESGLIPEGGTILDVGTGLNTTMLELYGDRWEVTPSDINVGPWNAHIPGMIQVDANYLGVSDPDTWDAIILSEVLEHVLNPLQVLEAACKALKPGGLLVVSVPFFYRIHEYGNHDPETTEPGLLDYWRFTPSGLALLMGKVNFETQWVGRLVHEDKTSFPEWDCPAGVVGWGIKDTGAWETDTFVQHIMRDDDWKPDIPEDWRQKQIELAQAYERRVLDASESVELA